MLLKRATWSRAPTPPRPRAKLSTHKPTTKKIGLSAITNIENTQLPDGEPVNPPLPDYAEPQKGSDADESGAPSSEPVSDETVEE